MGGRLDAVKLALVTTPVYVPFQFAEHLGVESIARVWREAGHEVVIFESTPDTPQHEAIAEFAPDVLGLSPFDWGADQAFEVARRVKRTLPQTHVVVGGVWATFNAQRILEVEPSVDSVCIGEGEKTAEDLAAAVGDASNAAGGPGFSDVAGLAWRDGPRVVVNPRRRLVRDLDSLPFPARDMLRARLTASGGQAQAHVSTSRGCTGRCTFCCISRLCLAQGGPIWRGRSPERVVDELEILRREYSVRGYFFTDGNFLDPGRVGRERAARLAELMVERHVEAPFFAFMCADDLAPGDPRLIEGLIRAGLRKVYLGIEAGTPETLKLYGKRATCQQNREAVAFLEKMALPLEIGFIMFHPWVTAAEVRENVRFLMEINQAHLLSSLCVTLEAYEGSAIMDRIHADGLLRKDWDYRQKYSYRFGQTGMFDLSQNLRALVSQLWARRIDYVLKQWDMWVAHGRSHRADGYAKWALDGYEQGRRRLSRLNETFLLAAVDLAERGWDQAVYQTLEAALEKEAGPLVDALEKLVGNLGQFVGARGWAAACREPSPAEEALPA